MESRRLRWDTRERKGYAISPSTGGTLGPLTFFDSLSFFSSLDECNHEFAGEKEQHESIIIFLGGELFIIDFCMRTRYGDCRVFV